MNRESIELYEEYVSIYNELDEYMRKTLGDQDFADHMTLIDSMSKKDRFFVANGRDLKNLAKLRNALVHNPYRKDAHPMASLHPMLVEKYRTLRNALLKPSLALTIAIPGANVFSTTPSTIAIDVISKMDKNTYTHVPVIESGKMVGVFSENVILSFLADRNEGIITNTTKISEFKDFTPVQKHRSEVFEFVSKTATVADVFKLFNDAIKVRKRIGVVFITQSGKPTEKYIGILTAWDLASYDGILAAS